jgi:hypothetical protein
MKLKPQHLFAAAFAILLVFALPAHAQLGLYGTVTLDQIAGLQTSPVRDTSVSYRNSVDPIGGTVGAYYDFRNAGPVRLGADLRGVFAHDSRGAQQSSVGPGTRIDSGLLGIRASFHTPFAYLRPYVQASAGIGRSNYGITSNNSVISTSTIQQPGITLQTGFEYHVFAGVDLPILPLLDFRVVELGYGGLDPFGTYSHNYPLRSLSSGIVFHLPSLP